ncbi:helix-turn-helix transcriptional regulator [Frigoribacterium sp. UYMn621]|uniref:helix-turn-helix domain-containing protein n=1 Tax=Frigoribacterium sp. UYMn621 TaxID=3156343 RepID=UPI003398F36C
MVNNEGASQWDEAFAQAVRRVREQNGMTQAWLASEMSDRGFEFHQATVYKVEMSKRRVSIGEAKAIAEVLGFASLDQFLDSESDSFAAINGRLMTASDEFVRSIVKTDRAALETLRTHQVMLRAIAAYDEKGFTITSGGTNYTAREHYAAAASFSLHEDFVAKLRTVEWPILSKMPWLTKGEVRLDGGDSPHRVDVTMNSEDYGFDRIDAGKLDAENWRMNGEMTDEAIRWFTRTFADTSAQDRLLLR